MRRRSFTLAAAVAAAAPTFADQKSEIPFSALGACLPFKDASDLKAAGGDYVEENVKRFLVPDKPESDWLQRFDAAQTAALPIRACNSFLPGSLRCVGADANSEAVLAYADTAFERARRVGVEIIVFGSSTSRALKQGDAKDQAEKQFVDMLKKMGPLAESRGVTIVVEPLRRQECNFINTVVEGAAIVERTNHPNIRLLFDIYHMLQNGENPNDLRTVGPLLRHGHVAEKEKRSAPGVMGDDFRPFFSALRAANYSGRLSVEGEWKMNELPKAYDVIRAQARA